MKAINHYIVIKKIKEAPKTVAGLELTETQNKEVRYLRAEVISAGNRVEGIDQGTVVRYDKHAGHKIEIENEIYHVIKVQDVVVVL